MGKIKEHYHEKIEKTMKEQTTEELIKAADEKMRGVDRLYKNTLKRIDQTNRAKIQKVIDRENAMSLRAYETAIIALYDYKKWFDNNDPEDKEKIIEIDFALNRINQLIQEM